MKCVFGRIGKMKTVKIKNLTRFTANTLAAIQSKHLQITVVLRNVAFTL